MKDIDIKKIENIASEAGKIIKSYIDTNTSLQYKSQRQVVTQADKNAENFIKEQLLKLYPFQFYGEESGGELYLDQDTWVVDPLDGTENLDGYPPLMAVSIGLVRNEKPHLGVIYDVVHDVMYSALEGQGAYSQGRRLFVSNEKDPNKAIVSLDFSSNLATRVETVNQLEKILQTARAVKVFGAPALSLAAVAAGKLDLYFRPATKLRDLIAGVILIQEASGLVVDYEGKQWSVMSKGIITGGQNIVNQFVASFS